MSRNNNLQQPKNVMNKMDHNDKTSPHVCVLYKTKSHHLQNKMCNCESANKMFKGPAIAPRKPQSRKQVQRRKMCTLNINMNKMCVKRLTDKKCNNKEKLFKVCNNDINLSETSVFNTMYSA